MFNLKLFSLYSKCRLFAKLVLKFLSHPTRFISKITPGRIWQFFKILKREGVVEATRRVNVLMPGKKIPRYSQKINIIKSNSTFNKITDYNPILFKNQNNPLVSIIIPAYNQFNYTYNCLQSIFNHTGDKISYEVIIANDCSDDLTQHIIEIVSNIVFITTPRNLGFLKNCNHAAKFTKGKYILFLNNDTQLQENWLLPLVELIEKDDTIGAVGSKLIYENGLLQEAGGILWNDASAWNYGKMGNPAMPEFNYVKEVDYISAAALMIKKSIWEAIGGFDENFAPAYYEDSDICFAIRRMGHKVMYQPESVVVHFEGITNGIGLNEGQKQYQAVNQNKFFEKWKSILEKEHFSNGENVFLARDRSRNKKTILFADHYVPNFDKDAGSRAAFQFLNSLVEMGFNVKFIGDDFYKHEPYTSILEQMGIEVLYGIYYFQNWKTWLKTNGQYIDFVILSRPHISVNYIDEVRKLTKAKVFYYGHDFYFLRESREYAVTKDIEKLKSAEKWKKLELSVMRKSDVVYYFSAVEVSMIKEIDPAINCKVMPLNIFPKVDFKDYDDNRKNLIFVGGFGHSPNIDGLIWFIDNIMPLVRNVISGVKLYVIGSNAPHNIKKLESDDIKILGYVDDSVLDEYYGKCRVCIVPLRYGAGVKGKVLEAMYKQIPLITTTIGAEGLPDIEECLIIEDDPSEFAKKLINMYNDYGLLKNLAKKGFDYTMKNFTFDRVKKIVNEDF